MKVYLVGGAVRDMLLNLPVRERDWVVVGGTPEQLRSLGYRQVGRDFPVFLHPKTQEEYALARTERKSGTGYYGFECHFGETVTLEEDLSRRDLTINAIAMGESGVIVDPFGGQKDLEGRWLRHVSPAFVEDPVRVLRIARFSARFAPLGFRVAPETRSLVYAMVRDGELENLVPERVWQECHTALGEKEPAVFFETLRATGALATLFPELDALFGVPAPPGYHPEIDTGIHTLQCLREAALLTDSLPVRFAVLVHDLGKALTPPNQWPHHYGHGEKGVAVIEAMCRRLRIPNEYRTLAVLVARYHGQMHSVAELRPQTVAKVLQETDAWRRPERFDMLLLACEADSRGAGRTTWPQAACWRKVLQAGLAVKPATEGLSGECIGKEIARARLEAIKIALNDWKHDEKQQ